MDQIVARDSTPGATLTGLTSADAERRLQQDGPNAIVDVAQHPLTRALLKLWAPVPWMLEAAIVLQLCLGEFVEGGVVAFLLLFNAGLSFVQEGRAQVTMDALKSRLALVASVQRDSKWISVPAATLVVGDFVKLTLGSVVAADVRLVQGSVLIDQSMLTGESVAVEAEAGSESYAGALVRRGEAIGQVIATGERTKFGRTAELVRSAKVESSQQKAIVRVVRNLALFNGGVTLLLTAYGFWLSLPVVALVSLLLVAVLASIPVALPSMFTLAAAVGARALGAEGVLPTRLSAVDEAGSIDVLCADKTGTLTLNALTVVAIQPMPGVDPAHMMALAALASSDSGQDPVDTAIQEAAKRHAARDPQTLVTFLPFDPATKRAEAVVRGADGASSRIIKGAFDVVCGLSQVPTEAAAAVQALQAKGFRVLAVAAGPQNSPQMLGLIALSDPPRPDSAGLVERLKSLGVRTVMVTGDARKTAEVVAAGIGIVGRVWATTPLPEDLHADDYALFAGVVPEDKYRLVKALQKSGHIVGMCGDGANDAPALRQAQMGIAVLTATDIAKSSAGVVLTTSGLGGVVSAIEEGRKTYQRILTYTLRTIIHKVAQVLLLGFGLLITGQAILTPMLMVLMMVTGDILAMSSSTDNVIPSLKPSVWNIGHLTLAALGMGVFDLCFCAASVATGKYVLHLDTVSLRTLTVVTLVFSAQAVLYVARERRHFWHSRPGRLLMASSVMDLSIIILLAGLGILMKPLSPLMLASLFAATIMFAFALDALKVALFRGLKIT